VKIFDVDEALAGEMWSKVHVVECGLKICFDIRVSVAFAFALIATIASTLSIKPEKWWIPCEERLQFCGNVSRRDRHIDHGIKPRDDHE
jgi:hypothetical protein